MQETEKKIKGNLGLDHKVPVFSYDPFKRHSNLIVKDLSKITYFEHSWRKNFNFNALNEPRHVENLRHFTAYVGHTMAQEEITSSDNHLKDSAQPTITTTDSDDDILPNEIESYSNAEDAGLFLENLFKNKETILNENWDSVESIQSKVISFNEESVYVDCLLDEELKYFESRVFPRKLFNNVTDLDNDIPILMKIKTKPGSFRIDIYPGKGLVNLDLFDLKDGWEELKGRVQDKKLDKW
ncbi:hypothetical protein [Psychroserpens mesophilus]|uniref:hypothetical protein n=1 Tax=Psychroserpens mesophilus TaxID=325473 RepID=UPI0005910496|nr:hypothetical protein [Psychroserpens mesophilus]